MTSPLGSAGRVYGVDVARCLALFGMAATHIFPAFTSDGDLHPSYDIAAGRASALFAVLAGVSLALVNGGRTAPEGRGLAAARAGVLARALLLLGVGLLLGAVESPPLVILAYYALLFAVAAVFLGQRRDALATAAVLAALVTPQLSHVLRQYVDPAPIEEPGGSDLLVELFLTGTYPVLTWSTYVLTGLAIGRANLRASSTAAVLLVGGVAAAVGAKLLSAVLLDIVGGPAALRGVPQPQQALEHGLFGTTPRQDWHWLTVAAPHSGTTLDLVHTTGSAAAVLGGCLLLTKVLPRLLFLPLAAAGSMTLTLYSLHVLALAEGSPFLTRDPQTLWTMHVLVALVVATVWRLGIGRGPLEGLAALVDRSARAVVGQPAQRQRMRR